MMKKLSGELELLAGRLPSDEQTLIARRAAKVQAMWKDAIEHVYKDVAPYVLEHVNAVYIKDENGLRTLMVYMDDGDFRSDVHCRQHLILLHLKQRYGEEIESFKAFPARFDMRKRHPYKDAATVSRETTRSVPLTGDEKAQVKRSCASVENPKLRCVLEKAMTADWEWKKGENKKNGEKRENRSLDGF